MTILPQYDEFGIYTTLDDITNYVSSLIEQGISSEEDVFSKCLDEFGKTYTSLIERVLYGEE